MVDPLSKFPTETVRQIFSPLNTAALTRSEATSKSWRTKLQSDPFLHQVLDLTSEKNKYARESLALTDETESINLLYRLSTASQHPIKHLHLDLLCFWDNFCKAEEQEDFIDPSIPAILSGVSKLSSLFTVIRLTGKLLEKLFISIPEDDAGLSYENATIFSELILDGGFELLGSLPNMKELHFVIPFPLSLSAGGLEWNEGDPSRKSKKITVVGFVVEGDGLMRNHGDAGICHKLLNKVNRITQRGLTSMELDLGRISREVEGAAEIWNRTEFEELIGEIRFSSTNLKSLNITFNLDYSSLIAWDLIIGCSSLSSLSILIISETRHVIDLQIPQTEQSSKFKHFTLETDHVKLECSSENFCRWIGSSLETLSLQRIEISSNALGSILKSNLSLKQLELIHVNVHQSPSSTLTAVSLPNLQSLAMYGDALSTFTNVSFPALMDLDIHQACVWSRNQEERAKVTKDSSEIFLQQLYSILSGCRSTLKTFSIGNAELSIEERLVRKISIPESISFPKLENLKLGSSADDDSAWLAELFSRFASPSIRVIEAKFKPSLMPVFSKLLISKSSSLVEIKFPHKFSFHWPQKQSSIVYPPISTLINQFSKTSFLDLKSLTLSEDMLPLWCLFSQSDLPKLQELNLTMNRDVYAKYEIESDELATWLVSILEKVSSSLVNFRLVQTLAKEDRKFLKFFPDPSSDTESDSEHGNEDRYTRRNKPKDDFKKSREKIEGLPIITFNRLDSLQTTSRVLFKFFKRCRFENEPELVKL